MELDMLSWSTSNVELELFTWNGSADPAARIYFRRIHVNVAIDWLFLSHT